MYDLISKLKITTHDLQILHRHLVGESWFPDHELIEEYYNELAEMTDDIAEIAIAMGFREPGLVESIGVQEPLKIEKRNSKTTFQIIQDLFIDLIVLFDDTKDSINLPDIVSKLEEYQYWLRKEATYKIERRLNSND